MKTTLRLLPVTSVLLLHLFGTAFSVAAQSFIRDPGFNGNQATTSDKTYYTIVLKHQPLSENNGKLIAVGNFGYYSGTHLKNAPIVRLNTDGTRDAEFTPPDVLTSGNILTITEEPDGQLLIGGTFIQITENGVTYSRGGLARLNHDGTLDKNFNLGGTTGFGAGSNRPNIWSILVKDSSTLSDAGNILVGGQFTTFAGGARSYLVELSGVNGSFIRDWGVQPSGWVPSSTGSGVYGMAFIPRTATNDPGEIYVVGEFGQVRETTTGTVRAATRIARLNRNGSVDVSFNTSATPGAYYPRGTPFEVIVDGAGLPIIGGNFTSYDSLTTSWSPTPVVNSVPRIAKLSRNGSMPKTFSGGFDATVRALVLKNDTLYVGGDFTMYGSVSSYTTPTGTSTCNKLVKLVPTSTTDPAFKLDDNFNIGSGFTNSVVDVQVQAVSYKIGSHLNSSTTTQVIEHLLVSGTMNAYNAASVTVQPQSNLMRLAGIIVLANYIADFKVVKQTADKVTIGWKASNSGIIHELQASSDGRNFSRVASFESAFSAQWLGHTLPLPSAPTYYRIAIKEGQSYSYSQTIRVESAALATSAIWKVSERTVAFKLGTPSKSVNMKIVNTGGQIIYEKQLAVQGNMVRQITDVSVSLNNCYVMLFDSEGRKLCSTYLP